MAHKTLLSWSSGKDAAMSLYRLKRDPSVEVVGLFTTVRDTDKKIPIHEIPFSKVQEQAKAVGLPLIKIELPADCPNTTYGNKLEEALVPYQSKGITHLAFGDLFLEDIRKFREALFSKMGFKLLFPLWGENTRLLAEEMIRLGIEARLTSTGVLFDQQFLNSLPANIDPCGENGEFHTFVHNFPDFTHRVN